MSLQNDSKMFGQTFIILEFKMVHPLNCTKNILLYIAQVLN